MIFKFFSLVTRNSTSELDKKAIRGAATDEFLQCLPDIVFNMGKCHGESATLGTQARISEIWPVGEV